MNSAIRPQDRAEYLAHLQRVLDQALPLSAAQADLIRRVFRMTDDGRKAAA